MTQVIACIDGSASATAVCDYAAWASLRLAAPLTLLHVLDKRLYPTPADLSGNIGLGSREQLLEELARLDEQRARLALAQGRNMLEAAKARVVKDGVADPVTRQRHGDLVENLQELENDMRLLVMGRQGESSSSDSHHVGSQLESVVRVMQRPVLVTPTTFRPPDSALLAFDGSATTRKGVEMLASSPLLKGLPIYVVMVGKPGNDAERLLEWARQALHDAGHQVRAEVLAGDVEAALTSYQQDNGIDLLVMGAYGHSRIRQFFIGSITTGMLRSSSGPLLLLR